MTSSFLPASASFHTSSLLMKLPLYMVMSFTPERHQEGIIALSLSRTHVRTPRHTNYTTVLPPTHTCTLTRAITHTGSVYFHPLSASRQHARSYEGPINADGDMYAAHICHASLPWQRQLPVVTGGLLVQRYGICLLQDGWLPVCTNISLRGHR